MRKVIITGLVSACLLAADCVKITSQPSDLTVNHGGQAAFMVAANGIGTISYQWEMYISATDSWAPITGATSGTYAIGPVDYEKDNGSKYRCVLKDSTGSKATTTEAKLAVVLKPAVITGQPESQVIAAGRTDVNFSVSAEGDDLMYSWVIRLSDGIDIRYSAGPYNSLTISEVTQTYNNSRVWCEVSNAIGSVKSDEAVLKVVGSDKIGRAHV